MHWFTLQVFVWFLQETLDSERSGKLARSRCRDRWGRWTPHVVHRAIAVVVLTVADLALEARGAQLSTTVPRSRFWCLYFGTLLLRK